MIAQAILEPINNFMLEFHMDSGRDLTQILLTHFADMFKDVKGRERQLNLPQWLVVIH